MTKSFYYELEERTYRFVERIRDYVNKLPKTIINIEYGKQLTRSGSSVGANYIEDKKQLQELQEIVKQGIENENKNFQKGIKKIKILVKIN